MLQPYRVLDLTDEKGQFCGKLLGDLGADVIKVEPPGGDPARTIGPFYQDVPGVNRSIWWWAYNCNKRGITLDIETATGRKLLKALAARSHIVLESFQPGYMDSLGIGCDALIKVNRGLVFCSITPFGQTGPRRDLLARDFISHAMSGNMCMTGDSDRPPLTCQMPTTYYHTCAEATTGVLSALWYSEETGEGQHVDVSIHEAMASVGTTAPAQYLLQGYKGKRAGAQYTVRTPSGQVHQREVWPCKDGFISFGIRGGPARAPGFRRLVKWMEEEGAPTGPLKSIDWDRYDSHSLSQEESDKITAPLQEFFLKKPVMELYEEAIKRVLMIAPVYGPKEIVADKQLAARGFFHQVEHPELDASFSYPGGFVQSSEAFVGVARRAPLLGEHNEEVYIQELGLTSRELETLKESKVV